MLNYELKWIQNILPHGLFIYNIEDQLLTKFIIDWFAKGSIFETAFSHEHKTF